MMPCNLLAISRRFTSLPHPEDDTSSFLRNFCQYLHSIACQTTLILFDTAGLNSRLRSGTTGFGKKAGDVTTSWSNCEILTPEGGAVQKDLHSKLEGTRRRGRPRKRWKEEVERDLQVVGVRRWRELVADRKKRKDIVRQAKAHSGLW